jgi:hypothetical protein
MTLQELKRALDTGNVSPNCYSLTSDGYGEIYRINRVTDILGDGWEVYYAERGSKNQLVVFRSESEACEHFYRWITSDHTVHRPNRS